MLVHREQDLLDLEFFLVGHDSVCCLDSCAGLRIELWGLIIYIAFCDAGVLLSLKRSKEMLCLCEQHIHD